MLKELKTRYTRKTHKYGIRVPQTVAEAYKIDKATETDYLPRAILKQRKITWLTLNFLTMEHTDRTSMDPIPYDF
jgi:hypothetical protein